MHSNVPAIVIFIVFTALCLFVARSGFMPKRITKGTFDKTIVYLLAEYSYKPEMMANLIRVITCDQLHDIKVPLSVTWAGAVKPQFEKVKNVSSMFSGISVVLLLWSSWAGYGLVRIAAFDIFLVGPVIVFIIVSFAYYFRSVASDFSHLEEKYNTTARAIKDTYFNTETLNELDNKIIDQIYNEIKIDLDVHKTNIGLGGIVLVLISVLMSLNGGISRVVPPSNALSLMTVIAMTTFFKWIYENYRSRIVYIGANAITRVKILRKSES